MLLKWLDDSENHEVDMCSGYMILHEIVWLLISTNLNKYLFGIIRSNTQSTGESKKLLVLRLHCG
jgi:hypothetical protein